MIRNIVLHIQGEQPMKADIESLPTAADAGLLCTNLRSLEGKKPLSTEFLDSVFLIPYNMIRFIEIPRASIGGSASGTDMPFRPAQIPAGASAAPTEDHVIVTAPPSPEPEAKPATDDEALEHLEPDEDLLRRIREA